MQNTSLSLPALVKWAIAGVVAWWAHDVPAMMQVLVVCIAIDYLTGALAAVLAGEWDWSQGVRGLVQKTALVSAIVFAHWLELRGGREWGAETLGAGGYAVNEVCSIFINFDKIGVPIPEEWIGALRAVRKVVRFRRATRAELAELEKDDETTG